MRLCTVRRVSHAKPSNRHNFKLREIKTFNIEIRCYFLHLTRGYIKEKNITFGKENLSIL